MAYGLLEDTNLHFSETSRHHCHLMIYYVAITPELYSSHAFSL